MGQYIAQADVELAYGAVNVAQWSSFTDGTNPTADTARITWAIAWAEGRANDMMQFSPYAVPVVASSGSGVPEEFKNICEELAGWKLWQTRGLNQTESIVETMTKRYKSAMRMLLQIKLGQYPIDAMRSTGHRNIPLVFGGGPCQR